MYNLHIMDASKYSEMEIGHYLGALLYHSQKLYDKQLRRKLTESGLSLERFYILQDIYVLGEKACLSALIKRTMLEPHTVSALISRMEKDGLVVKKYFEKPKNMVKLEITEKGAKAMDIAWQQTPTLNEFWNPLLSLQDIEILLGLLYKLMAGNLLPTYGYNKEWHTLTPEYNKESTLSRFHIDQ
ncbi:MarR family transcriptional regulator [Dehalococcoides mccartyi]|uniref:MarR family transcriptional regulator n=1 Tax=Dehalococcoides mccartyi TaxID=61435 RepID=A0A2J1E0G3_9CHLR|nr:MarR family transcriptional regulator [Dehalococcoides mccartyi]